MKNGKKQGITLYRIYSNDTERLYKLMVGKASLTPESAAFKRLIGTLERTKGQINLGEIYFSPDGRLTVELSLVLKGNRRPNG